MIYDNGTGELEKDCSKPQSESSRDEFTLGFEHGYYIENYGSKIEEFSAPKGSFPDYQMMEDDRLKLDKNTSSVNSQTIETDKIEITSSSNGSKFDRELNSEEMNLVGSSFDNRKVRNRWIDAVENLLDLAGYAKGQLNSKKQFGDKIIEQDMKEPEKWMLMPSL